VNSISTIQASGPAFASADTLAELLDAELAPLADRIDHEGFYPEALIRRLGAAGVYSRHLAAFAPGPRDLGGAIADMGEVAARCMSTAFCAWCQDACGWYLENTDNTALRDKLQGGIADGTLLGGTGLSNPIKALSGIEVTGAKPGAEALSDGLASHADDVG